MPQTFGGISDTAEVSRRKMKLLSLLEKKKKGLPSNMVSKERGNLRFFPMPISSHPNLA